MKFTKKILKHRKKIVPYFLIIIGVGFGIAAISLSIYSNANGPKAPPGALTAGNAPSSNKPNTQDIANYSVPPTFPKYITIPSIGVPQSRVVQLGVLKSGQIAAPNNIYDTGWYNGSAKPGQNGAMFIYGHVSSWTANGVFANLKKLKPGNIILITRGDNKVYEYRVVETNTYPYNNVPMNTVLSPTSSSVPGLSLMTCTGQIIKGTSEFNERLVVYANLVT